MPLECPFTINAGFTKNTKFQLRDDVEEEEFTEVSNWGAVKHFCGPAHIRTPTGLCSKTAHSDTCTSSSTTNTFNHRKFAHQAKQERKRDQVTTAAVMANNLINQFKSNLDTPLLQLPEDFDLKNGINRQKIAAVLHRADAKTKPPMSSGGIPDNLVYYQITDGHYEQFIYPEDGFIGFCLPRDLPLMTSKAIMCDGTFSACSKLENYDATTCQLYQYVCKFEIGDRVFSYCIAQFLMADRKKATYLKVFDFLERLWNTHYPDRDPFFIRHLHCDYEKAFCSAVLEKFPGCQLVLCSFHYSQTQFRR